MTAGYALAASSVRLSEKAERKVAQLVAERAEAKGQRDYGRADAVRDELRNDFGVVVDDRVKEYTVDPSSRYAVDAEDSQRSAYKRAHPSTDEEAGEDSTVEEAVVDSTAVETLADSTVSSTDSTGAPVAAPAAALAGDLESLTVVELKAQLKARGLAVSGKKADLILRLSA